MPAPADGARISETRCEPGAVTHPSAEASFVNSPLRSWIRPPERRYSTPLLQKKQHITINHAGTAKTNKRECQNKSKIACEKQNARQRLTPETQDNVDEHRQVVRQSGSVLLSVLLFVLLSARVCVCVCACAVCLSVCLPDRRLVFVTLGSFDCGQPFDNTTTVLWQLCG